MTDPQEFLSQVNDKILEHGHVVQYVGGEAPFAYTVGRTMRKRPELFITGPFLAPDVQTILNAVVDYDDEHGIEPDKLIVGALEGSYALLPIEVDPEVAELFVARATFGTIQAVQLLWPDKEGRYPTDPECTVKGLQPIHRKA